MFINGDSVKEVTKWQKKEVGKCKLLRLVYLSVFKVLGKRRWGNCLKIAPIYMMIKAMWYIMMLLYVCTNSNARHDSALMLFYFNM